MKQSYLTFRSHSLIYGIKIHLVKEIFQLPELTIIPETPGDIIGVLYLRDKTIPVMHLDRRLGQPVKECSISDRVIVIQWQTIEMGIVVNEVLDVVEIDSNNIESEPNYGRENSLSTAFIANIATLEDQKLILLNSETLIRKPDLVKELIEESNETDTKAEESTSEVPLFSNFFDLYCPNATAKDRAIFQQRAKELQQPLEIGDSDGTMPLAVFSLGQEYMGCDLSVVKEFIDLDKVTPIPCCPNHIVGNINLRGEIITLVDIRSVLNFAQGEKSPSQAILVEIDDISAGIIVDEIFDVFNVDREQLNPTPTGLAADIKKYFHGMTTYENNILSALDLPKIFAEGNLVIR